MDYRFFSSGDGNDMADGVGGFMAITPEMAAGGTIYQEPQEIPGGDFSLIAQDLDSAYFGLVGARASAHA